MLATAYWITPSTTNVGSEWVVGWEVSKQPPWSMATSTITEPGFSAGITLSAITIKINWQAILGSIMKMIVMPAVVLILGLLFHMDPFNLKMLVVAAALPPAFSGIIIADEYNTYVATGTSSLTLSVILFIGFCPLWIWLTDLALAA